MKAYSYFYSRYISSAASTAGCLGLLCAITLWFSGPGTARCQNSVQRDQQAITILTQTIAAGGGQQSLAAIQDLAETGTITYNFSTPATGTVTVKSRGLHDLRIDADLPEGKRSTVVSGDGGSLTETNGRIRQIHGRNARNLGGVAVPYLRLIAALRDSSSSIIYSGLVTHDGVPEYDIRLQKANTKQNIGGIEGRDYYIDPTTFLVAAVSDRMYNGGGSDAGITREYLYSNYQQANGIVLPLTIAETVQGVVGFTMTLTHVSANSGLADSEFTW